MYRSAGKTPKVTPPASLILVTTSYLSRAPPSLNLYTPDVQSPWDLVLLDRLTWKSAGRFRQKQPESHVKTERPSPPSPLRGHRQLAHPILKVPVWCHNCSVKDDGCCVWGTALYSKYVPINLPMLSAPKKNLFISLFHFAPSFLQLSTLYWHWSSIH